MICIFDLCVFVIGVLVAMFFVIPCGHLQLLFSRYKNDPEILAMTNLIAAYQRNEILEFEKILKVSDCVHHDFM